jgi:hypothetical protein
MAVYCNFKRHHVHCFLFGQNSVKKLTEEEKESLPVLYRDNRRSKSTTSAQKRGSISDMKLKRVYEQRMTKALKKLLEPGREACLALLELDMSREELEEAAFSCQLSGSD